ncbi:MAG: hypothetical protein ACLUJG_00885 [Lawsonibacter sp.]
MLPYDDGRLAFAAILPNSPDLSGWLDSLDGNGPVPAGTGRKAAVLLSGSAQV